MPLRAGNASPDRRGQPSSVASAVAGLSSGRPRRLLAPSVCHREPEAGEAGWVYFGDIHLAVVDTLRESNQWPERAKGGSICEGLPRALCARLP